MSHRKNKRFLMTLVLLSLPKRVLCEPLAHQRALGRRQTLGAQGGMSNQSLLTSPRILAYRTGLTISRDNRGGNTGLVVLSALVAWFFTAHHIRDDVCLPSSHESHVSIG